MSQGEDRSVSIGGAATGSSIVTGDGNTVRTDYRQATLPQPGSVDAAAEIAELRKLLAELAGPEEGKISRAMEDAGEEAARDVPDKGEVAVALERAVGWAKKAEAFSAHAEKIAPRILALAAWLGPQGARLLGLLG